MRDSDITSFYEDRFDEADRLREGSGRLELLRTRQIVGRHLGDRALRIADIGGGPGVYAEWLAGLGHHVVLIDPMERHVDQARERDAGPGSIRAEVGDARALPLEDDGVDVALLLGPLYPLPDSGDRHRTLQEAARILRPGGRIFAAAISRYASLHDGLVHRWLLEPEFAAIAHDDLRTGRHENPDGRPGWYTTAYFHRPDELRDEMNGAGFDDVAVVGLEGLAGWLPDLDERLDDPDEQAMILDVLARLEAEPGLLGLSAHLLASGVRPA